MSLNTIEISRSRLAKNTELLKSYNPDVAIAPVLKANAYGHGLELIGEYLDQEGFPFYCVNSILEANRLRAVGVKTDILIMGYVGETALKEKEWDYIFAIFDMEQARMVSALQKNPRVHITIETGLHREGLDILQRESLLDELKDLKNLQVEGMLSHFACSNDPACPTTVQQIERFTQAKANVLEKGFTPKWFHFGGSLALLNTLSGTCNIVRCGKAFFGIALNSSYQNTKDSNEADPRLQEFQQVLEFKSQIAQIKHIKKGDHVSYADAFIADRDMTIGILPVGYSDGLERRLSNIGKVVVKGKLCSMLGVVAMNVNVIDITEVANPQVGQEVVLYSSDSELPNTLDNVAKACGTLPQDLLSHVSPSIPRTFVD